MKIDKNCISICVVIDGPISDYWNEEIYEIGTSIISNFNENYCLASFAGAMLSVRRSSWGSLASAMVSAAGFLLAVVAVALLCWQQITWLGRGGVLLLCGAGGGLLAGLLGGRRRKRKRRPVRRGRKA